MNADQPPGTDERPAAVYAHAELSRRVIGVFYDVYNELGVGFLEPVYQRALSLALTDAGLPAEREVPIAVHFRGRPIGVFRPDFVIARRLIVELKATRILKPVYQAQVLNYLRASSFEVALLLYFGPEPAVKRLAFSNDRKPGLRSSALICGHPPCATRSDSRRELPPPEWCSETRPLQP